MDNPVCPHCNKPIELMGAKELGDEYGIGPNSVSHARKRGHFPEPFLSFGNRNLYLRSAIEAWVLEHRQPKGKLPPEVLAQQFAAMLEELPPARRKELQKLAGLK